MKKHLFGILLSILLMYSCHGPKEEGSSYNLLQPTGELKVIPITANIPALSDCMHQEQIDGKDILLMKGKENDVIYIDIDSGLVVDHVKLDVEGPNGIGYLKSFSLASDSSLYVFSKPFTLFEVNRAGEVISVFDYTFENVENLGGPTGSFNTIGGKIYQEGDKIRFTTLPEGDWNRLSESFLNSFRHELELDLYTGSMRKVNHTYPTGYFNEGVFDVYFNRVKVGNRYVYSYATDHNVYTIDPESTIKKYPAKSEFVDNFENYASSSILDYLYTVIKNPRYKHIIYDEFKEVYYRFVYVGEELDTKQIESQTLEEKAKSLSNLSIIILDKELKRLGETKLPKDKYNASNYFITEDGLFLSINNPSNPSMREDALQFEKLELFME